MIPDIAEQLFVSFADYREELYLVGGAVRDFYIHKLESDPAINERPITTPYVPKDLDFATSAHPEKTIKILKHLGLPVYRIGEEFGTIGTMFMDYPVEITTYRCKESYTKGSRKPKVVYGTSLKEDLKRRDFTINAMAMGADGQLIDPFDGFGSYVQGVLMTPNEPEESFTDDPLRMLRAYRFEARHCGHPAAQEVEAIKKLKKEIHTVSAERIFDEMTKILMTDKPSLGLKPMGDVGLLGEIFPELQVVIDFKQNQGRWHSKLVWPHVLDVVDNAPPIKEVRWAALFHDIAKPQTYSETESGVHFYTHEPKGAYMWNKIADRLKVSREFKEEIYYLIFHHLRFSQLASSKPVVIATKQALRRFIRDCGSYMENLYLLSMADITSHHPDVVQEKKAKCTKLKAAIDEINAECNVLTLKLPKGLGKDVAAALEIPLGPELGSIMKTLQDWLVRGLLTEESDFIEAAKKYKRGQDGIRELVRLSEEAGLYEHQQRDKEESPP